MLNFKGFSFGFNGDLFILFVKGFLEINTSTPLDSKNSK
jgi:hypothetical protein